MLSTEEKWPELARIVLTATTAFGVRMHRAAAVEAQAGVSRQRPAFGPVRIKLGLLGDEIVQAAPEYDSCLQNCHAR